MFYLLRDSWLEDWADRKLGKSEREKRKVKKLSERKWGKRKDLLRRSCLQPGYVSRRALETEGSSIHTRGWSLAIQHLKMNIQQRRDRKPTSSTEAPNPGMQPKQKKKVFQNKTLKVTVGTPESAQ